MFVREALRINASEVVRDLSERIRSDILGALARRGAVVGMSGGIDSSVVAALCARALGADRTLGLLMPDRDSAPESTSLARAVADRLGITVVVEDITAALAGVGCYRRQHEAIRMVVPEFGEGWAFKLTIPPLLGSDRLNITRLTTRDPAGVERTWRMTSAAYAQLVAATNFKQRIRTAFEYYHADRLRYAVVGTPNILEHELGFFVKQGDGAADLKPIAHLYKSQVYALAEELGIPAEVRERVPTTDTFPLRQTQDEFFFALPHEQVDLALFALDHDVPVDEAAPVLGIAPEDVRRVYDDIRAKRRATTYLHREALVATPVRS